MTKVPVPSSPSPLPMKQLQPPCHPLCASQHSHSHFQGSEVRPGHLVSLLHHAIELAVHHHTGIWTFTCDSNRSRGGSQIRGFNTPALWHGKRQPGASPEPVLCILREFSARANHPGSIVFNGPSGSITQCFIALIKPRFLSTFFLGNFSAETLGQW